MNDSRLAPTGAVRALSGMNIAAALASGAFGAIALARPATLVGSPVAANPATGFYADMYALRTLVITAGLITASLSMRRSPLVAAITLAGGGLVQLGDVAIAARRGTPGVVGASVAAAVHLASAGLILRHARRPWPR